MERREFNKLIRDRIPEKIAADNAIASIRELEPTEYIAALKAKVVEEARELAEAEGEALIAEIADVQEVLETLMTELQITHEQVTEVKEAKASKNGTFQKRLFLEWTEK